MALMLRKPQKRSYVSNHTVDAHFAAFRNAGFYLDSWPYQQERYGLIRIGVISWCFSGFCHHPHIKAFHSIELVARDRSPARLFSPESVPSEPTEDFKPKELSREGLDLLRLRFPDKKRLKRGLSRICLCQLHRNIGLLPSNYTNSPW